MTSLLLALTLGTAGATEAPAADPATRAIVNGERESGFPAAVAIGADLGNFRFNFCSASIIAPRMLLTAGHCIREVARQFNVDDEALEEVGAAFIGEEIPQRGGDVISVPFKKIHVHPDYGTGRAGQPIADIAIIELAEEVPDSVTPVWFAETGLDDVSGIDVVSVGYGVTSSSAQNSSGIKRSAVLTISDVDEQFLYSDASQNEGRTNVCSGDSGGPQFHIDENGKITQWAVHSFVYSLRGGDPCLQNSGSTRTDAFTDFLLDKIEDVYGTTDRCEINGLYADRTCDSDCAEEDPICIADEDGDGFVSDDEFDAFDIDGDGELSDDELDPDEIEKRKRGCDTGGAAPAGILAVMGLVALRRRRQA